MKLGKIVEVVMRCQQDANAAAAPSTQNIFEAMQNILDQRGIQMSARQFAQQHGIDTTRMLGSPNKEAVAQQVNGLLGQAGPPEASGTRQRHHDSACTAGQRRRRRTPPPPRPTDTASAGGDRPAPPRLAAARWPDCLKRRRRRREWPQLSRVRINTVHSAGPPGPDSTRQPAANAPLPSMLRHPLCRPTHLTPRPWLPPRRPMPSRKGSITPLLRAHPHRAH